MRNDLVRKLKEVIDGIEKIGNNALNPIGLTLTQCAVLGFLHTLENNTAPLKKIEKEFNVSQATMQGIITRLESKNFVALKEDEHDKRMKIVSMTELGVEILQKAHEQRIKTEKIIFSNFTEGEKDLLLSMLEKITIKI